MIKTASHHESLRIPIKQLDKGLPVPSYAYPGDAGVDLTSTVSLTINPMEREVVPCGVALGLPRGYAGLVLPRSGLAAKHGITLVNAPGLIDSDYRGEIKAILMNLDSHEPFRIERGDRIAQLVIMPVPVVNLRSVDELDETVRGTGGFGSSGVSSAS